MFRFKRKGSLQNTFAIVLLGIRPEKVVDAVPLFPGSFFTGGQRRQKFIEIAGFLSAGHLPDIKHEIPEVILAVNVIKIADEGFHTPCQ